jgi:hypothetical protein
LSPKTIKHTSAASWYPYPPCPGRIVS